jgi:hypothetical protein
VEKGILAALVERNLDTEVTDEGGKDQNRQKKQGTTGSQERGESFWVEFDVVAVHHYKNEALL